MTKKHFEAVAKAMRLQREYIEATYASDFGLRTTALQAIHEACVRLADEFQMINPRFDRATFTRAC